MNVTMWAVPGLHGQLGVVLQMNLACAGALFGYKRSDAEYQQRSFEKLCGHGSASEAVTAFLPAWWSKAFKVILWVVLCLQRQLEVALPARLGWKCAPAKACRSPPAGCSSRHQSAFLQETALQWKRCPPVQVGQGVSQGCCALMQAAAAATHLEAMQACTCMRWQTDKKTHHDLLQAAVAGTDFYEDYTGVRLPLPKLDMVAIPGKRGAVEHWGLLQFDEERMLVNKVGAYTS